jgi:hypothetical protein
MKILPALLLFTGSGLAQINRDNVNNLSLKWVYRPSPLASVGPEGGPNDLLCPNRTDTEGWRGTTRRLVYDPLILEVFSDVIE